MKTLMRRLIPLLILASASASAAEPRYSGAAGLSAGPEAGVVSADGRYNLQAGLLPDTSMQSNGRFGLSAKLQPDPNSIEATCGPVVDRIFQNGFE